MAQEQQNVPAWFEEKKMNGHTRRGLLRDFTIHDRGYMRWYKGAPRWVCGKSVDPEDVHDAWDDKRKAIDGEKVAAAVKRRTGTTVRQAAGEFYAWLEKCVKVGVPVRKSRYTQQDYLRWVNAFGRSVGPDREIADLSQKDFSGFLDTLAGKAPSTRSRVVANVQGFFTWCADEGLIASVPTYGRSFVKPPKQEHRDRRIEQQKSYTVREFRALWEKATETQRLWIALGVNGAFDNADLANLTDDVIDWQAKSIDYRRRKVGKARRVVPLRPETVDLLKAYRRPVPASPEHAGLFLLTENGLPLGRMKDSKNPRRAGMANPIDAVARSWTKLMMSAGLRQKPKVVTSTGKGATRRRTIKYAGDADGRGFRSLRTTFVNLVPIGYRDERDIIMGHLKGGVLVENYLERFGLERLREVVDHVWNVLFTSPLPPDEAKPAEKAGASGRARKGRAAAKPNPSR